ATPTMKTLIDAGSGGLNYPSGLTFGPGGKLFVVDLGATTPFVGQILQFEANGTFDKVFSESGKLDFQFPSDVVFGSDVHLLTADLGPAHPPGLQGSISQFNSDGSLNKVIVSSAQFPNTGQGTSGISPSQLTLYITANAGGPYRVKEGSSLTLQAKASALG